MPRVVTGTLLLALFLLGTSLAQDPKKEVKKAEETKVRGQLPNNFKKLGLTDKQIQDVYKLRAEYKEKTESLKKQIEKLKSEEKEALDKLLTPEQLKRLRELRGGG